jgi:hypothetical protein
VSIALRLPRSHPRITQTFSLHTIRHSYFIVKMPPKATTTDLNGTKFVPADCVSVLLMALGNTTITKQQLNMMSALDGTRTASSFEHQFRSIIAKAKDLKARVDDGEEFTLVPSGKKRG